MKKNLLMLCVLLWSVACWSAPLTNNLAFPLKITKLPDHQIALDWSLPEGYFIYKKSLSIQLTSNPAAQIQPQAFPRPQLKKKHDNNILEIYRHQLHLIVNLPAISAKKDTLIIGFQGCADAGYCYPMMSVKYAVNPQPSSIFRMLWQLLGFYGFGLLLSLTPCVLPMIPILSGLIIGQKQPTSTRKAFFLSLSYVLSMSVMYSIIGGVIALMGANLQLIMQAPAMIYAFSGLCFLMGLAMFDVYQFKLPLSCQRFLASITQHQAGGEYLGAAIMGALSILILSPCVTAPMIGALGYVAQNGSSLFGLFALFGLGLGMGTPLLIIGTGAGKLLPHTGPWMNGIKHLFGLVFFVIGLHLIARFLPNPLNMALWSGLLMFISLSLRPFQRATCAGETIKQTFGFLGFIYSILLMIGASLGHQNLWLPLVSAGGVENSVKSNNFVISKAELDRKLAQANGRPVLIYFYADWCASCKWVHDYLLQQVKVQQALKSFVILPVDITQNNQNSKELLNTYGVVAPPTFIFVNAQGAEQSNLRIAGEPSIHTLLHNLHLTNPDKL